MIDFQRVSKFYGDQDVLVEASFTVNPGERVGIVGPNGAGKSTIFAMINGQIIPDKGEVVFPRKTRFGHLRQELRADSVDQVLLNYVVDGVPELKALHGEIETLEAGLGEVDAATREKNLLRIGVLQDQFEHAGGYDIETRASAALCGLGFQDAGLKKPFKEFSGGWQMRAELARTLITRPDVLLLDEPSNYLDLPAVEWLQRFLRSFAGTLLLVSHDRYLLDSLTNVTLEVMMGKVTRYSGNYSAYLIERESRYAQVSAAAKNQARRREEIERFITRFRAKNTKATQVQSRMKQLEKMEEIQVPATSPDLSLIKIPDPPHCGTTVLHVEGISKTYDGSVYVLKDIEVALQRGDKVALVGYNGMGKTTLLRILAGELPYSDGKRILGHKVVIGYQSQEFADTMPPEKSAYDIVRAATTQSDDKQVRTILGMFGFSGESALKPCKVLSGGEKIRLAFARIFINPPNLLVLDEPTTHLDINGRRALEEALASYAGAVCLVSHDVTFVQKTANHIIAMNPPGITRYHGDYTYYREKTSGEQAPAVASASAPKDITGGKDKKQLRKERAEQREALKRKTRGLEKVITKAEARIEELEAEQTKVFALLSANEPGTDFEDLNRRLGLIQGMLVQANKEWDIAVDELDRAQRDMET
ncbi:MAG: ATP-binding cassette subfamily F protein 3 [Kiritimatiellia bacterium]|jgi:ATP-binding cassette subfamily F protein 3